MLLAPVRPVARTGLCRESRHAVVVVAAFCKHEAGRLGSIQPRCWRVGRPHAPRSWQGRAGGLAVFQLGRPDLQRAGERLPRYPGSARQPLPGTGGSGGCPSGGAARSPAAPRRGWSRSRSRGPAGRRLARAGCGGPASLRNARERRRRGQAAPSGLGGGLLQPAHLAHARPFLPERCLEGRAGPWVTGGTEGRGIPSSPASRRAALAPQHLPPCPGPAAAGGAEHRPGCRSPSPDAADTSLPGWQEQVRSLPIP